LGEQVSQTVNGATTNYQIDPTGLGYIVAAFSGAGVYNNSGGLVGHYTYGLGLVSQVAPGAAASYYDFDLTGNTIGITNAAGNYVNSYAYLPFGQATTIRATTTNGFTFVGQFGVTAIAGGLLSMRFRVYDPITGQFLSNDPLGVASDTNFRRYASNSPTDLIDPSGLCFDLPFDGSPAPGPYGDAPGRRTYAEIQRAVEAGEETVEPLVQEGEGGAGFLEGEAGGAAVEGGATLGVAALGLVGGFAIGKYLILPNLPSDYQDGTALYNLWQKLAGGSGPCTCKCPPNAPANAPCRHRASGTTPNHGAVDPNALIGPSGFGTQGFIAPSGNWSYTVEFENDGTAAALAVTATEQLDLNLDWSTFQLGSFGFGPINVSIPPSLTDYETTVAYQNTDGSSLNVQVALDFNVQTGLLTVTFTSLDPSTGEAPTGVFDGFLPPDNSSGIGDGYVQYTVSPKSSLTTGTTINQQASVVFDTNAAIVTNPAVNTIDAGPPSSTVAPLPATTTNSSFTVSWSGQDDPGGSGIAFYNISVSDDGGPYSVWQSDTTQTSAIFTGQVGHTYSFYSVATDNVGNVQPTPASAQQTVQVVQAATATAVTPGTATVSYGESATFTAAVSSTAGAPPDGSVQFLVNGAAYGSPVALNAATAQLAITEPVGSYTIAAQYTGDANYAATLAAAETTATLTVSPAVSPATNLAISPNTGISSGLSDTGAVTFTGNLSAAGITVDVFDTSTNTDLGNATVTGTSFSLHLHLAEGSHALRARATLDGTYADAFFTVLVDLTPPSSHVVNSLGTSQSSDTFPVSVTFSDPAGAGGAPASGVSSVDLYVSDNNGPFSLYQTLNVAPAASGTVTFTFVGQDRNLYAFHSIALDAAGNTEIKSNSAIEASTSVPDLHPPVTHILASGPSYSWGPFPASEFSSLAPSSYSNGVFTLNWAGVDPDQNTGAPAGSIALVNVYVEVDGGAPVLIAQLTGGTANGNGVYSGSITYNALADGLSHTYSFYSVGVDDQQLKQYAPQGGPAAADVAFTATYTAAFAVQNLVVEKNIAERSFIQYLDLNFNQTAATSPALQSLAAGLAGTSPNSFVELEWYGENLTASSGPQGSVNLFNKGTTASVSLTGNDLSINFGPSGITSLLTETGVKGTGSPTSSF
ncbi:MAG: RHS repeat-associated core domain-containing protein, partial [Isosphaeraceae bacterium]